MNPTSSDSLLKKSEKLLRSHGNENPRLEVELLLSHVLQCKRIDLYSSRYDSLTEAEVESFKALLERRLEGEPIAYLLGKKEFYGHDFFVNSATLIPRPETELLVEEVSKHLRSQPESQSLLDLGTGTGCIALSLAHLHPELKVTAVDLSEKAIEVAQKNAKQLALPESQVTFLKRDVLDESFWEELSPVSVIVSNPPYIGEKERVDISREVLDYEPEGALFARKEGLKFYETFAVHGRKLLKPQGKLFLELSPIIYERVKEVFLDSSWDLEETIQDYAGHPRHIVLS